MRPVSAAVGVNEQFNYQGKLTDSGGAPVADGDYLMKFSLYTSSVGGSPFWTASGTTSAITSIPVSVNNGLFTVRLGDTSASGQWQNPLSSSGTEWNTDGLYLGVTISGDSEMTPRKRLTSVPQAFNAMRLQGMAASGTALSGESLFTIRQTSNTAAASDRFALEVRTDGISTTYDSIARFVNSSGTAVMDVRSDQIRGNKRLFVVASSTDSHGVFEVRDGGALSYGRTWAARFNTLLVNSDITDTTTGTADFVSVFKYTNSFQNAICLDNSDTASTCRRYAGASMVAEGNIQAAAFNTVSFDLAERYQLTGPAEPGDVLTIDPEHPMFVQRSPGIAYDPKIVGIVSTAPGVVLGDEGEAILALSGRVPTKVSAMNGAIAVGDVLTSSPIPGVAMKATAPGRIIGYALQATATTGTIEVFVKVGYDAGSFLQAENGQAIAKGNLVMDAQAPATASTSSDSWGITWRGNVWDGVQSVKNEFSLLNKGLDGGRSALSLIMGTSTLWSVDNEGSARVAKDLFLGGRFFPATRSGVQSDKYIFLDDTGPASSTYIATNADGWQANTSYDFAERYYSPEQLEPGDVVVLSQRGQFHVQRSLTVDDVPVGIVSTRPAFVAGAPAPDTYPIALAGRVPTKVSTMSGSIAIGDPLAPSTLPGVVVKATKAGPIVGYALETYTSDVPGKIEVFVNAGWWGGAAQMTETRTNNSATIESSTENALPKSYQGVARILAGAVKVKVTHPSLGTFPLIQVTPYGKVDTQWWTDNSSDHGFQIVLKEPLSHDVTFSWRAEEMQPTDDQLFQSDDQTVQWDIHTGQPVLSSGGGIQTQIETLPDVTSTPTITPSVPVDTASSTPVESTPTDPETPSEPVTPAPVEEPGSDESTVPVVEPSVEPTAEPSPTPIIESVPVETPPASS